MREDAPNFDLLYGLAERQLGFFTAHQALAAGYSRPSHSYHVKIKDWQRWERGIYRLSRFPSIGRQDVMLAYLWCSDINGVPQGVVSHDTALEVHKLSTWITTKYHLTVPKGFRKRGESNFQVQLHCNDLAPCDVEVVSGFRATKPLKTIVDLLEFGHLESRHLKDALVQAWREYKILPNDIRQITLTDDQMQRFKALIEMTNDKSIMSLL